MGQNHKCHFAVRPLLCDKFIEITIFIIRIINAPKMILHVGAYNHQNTMIKGTLLTKII